jgi:hypothetical protein
MLRAGKANATLVLNLRAANLFLIQHPFRMLILADLSDSMRDSRAF